MKKILFVALLVVSSASLCSDSSVTTNVQHVMVEVTETKPVATSVSHQTRTGKKSRVRKILGRRFFKIARVVLISTVVVNLVCTAVFYGTVAAIVICCY